MTGARPGIGVDVDEAVEPHVEAAFFARLADRGGDERLAAIDVAAGKHPLAVAGLDGAPHQHEPAIVALDDRADGDLRIEVEDEAAPRADEALGLAGLQQPRARARRRSAGRSGRRANRRAGGAGNRPRRTKYNSAGHVDSESRAHGPSRCCARRRAPLDRGEIKSPAVQKLIDDMIDTMVEYHGVGLAAPQVHEGAAPVRRLARRRRRRRASEAEPLVVINPEITVVGADTVEDWEGCLSIPDIRGRVPRAREIKLRALDRQGRAHRARRRTTFRRASSSTKPIISTACCSSIG